VHDAQTLPRDLELVAVAHGAVGLPVGIDDVPQHLVVGVQEDGRAAGRTRQLVGGVDVVVVPVRAQDRPDRPIADCSRDRRGIVRGVDDEDLMVVADEPDVVHDVEVLAIEREDAGRRDVLDHHGRGR